MINCDVQSVVVWLVRNTPIQELMKVTGRLLKTLICFVSIAPFPINSRVVTVVKSPPLNHLAHVKFVVVCYVARVAVSAKITHLTKRVPDAPKRGAKSKSSKSKVKSGRARR